MNLSELTDKELAILLAENLKEWHQVQVFKDMPISVEYMPRRIIHKVEKYLSDKASQILFGDKNAMAGKITNYLIGQGADIATVYDFWTCQNNNGTLEPRKIIEVYLSMENSNAL